MAEESSELKIPSITWKKPIWGGFLGILITAVVYLYIDNQNCNKGRIRDYDKWTNKFVEYATQVGELKKKEIIQETQPKIDELKESTDSMMQEIQTLRKTKKNGK